MNPHTEHPDEGPDPSAGQAAAQSARQSGTASGSSAVGHRPEADGHPTTPLDTSATLPLDFPAGAAAGSRTDAGTDPGMGTGADPGTGAGTDPGTPPPYYGPSYGPTPPPAGSPQNFFDWIRSQGVYRGRERWVGGVASGVAQRFGVDPLIVRGILIVLTVFAGVGVLLYGIAWALLPEPDGRIHVQEAAAGRWSSGMTGALITTVIGFPSLGNGFWGWDRYGLGAIIWTVLWVGGVIYAVYYLTQRNKTPNGVAPMSASQPGGPDGPSHPAGPSAPAGGAPFAATGQATSAALPRYGGKPAVHGPAWDAPPPSGPTPPPGGYWPPPGGGPVPPATTRNFGPGAPAIAVTVGLALLTGGGLKALDVANVIDLGTASNAVVWASAALVLGLGILVVGLRGRTSGILGFFAVAALIAGGIYSVLPNGDRFRPQNEDWSPVSIEQARSGFDITAGTGTVDLTGLALNPPLGSDLVVPIDATMSNLTVVIPDTVPVQIRADMTMGNLNERGGNHGGMTTQQSSYNTDRPGAALIVTIDGTFSNVTVKEGN